MPVIFDLDVDLDIEAFLESQGEAVRHPRARELGRWAVSEARESRLIRPALVYEWVPVEEVAAGRVQAGGVTLCLGRHAELMESACAAFVCVITIGPDLEERARQLAAEGSTFDSYMLGEVGVFVVGNVLLAAHRLVEEQAAERGWGVGAELAPGQLAGWDVAEQKLLCGLLDIAAIGVSVTTGGMLTPQKSVSCMVGGGPGYESAEVRSPCEFCAQGEICRYRH